MDSSLSRKDELILLLSDLRHTLVKYWLENKDRPTFNARPYNIISRNIDSIQKNIKKL